MQVGDLIKRKTPKNGWIPNPEIFGEDYYTVFGIITSFVGDVNGSDYCFVAFSAGKKAGKIIKIRLDRVELINENR